MHSKVLLIVVPSIGHCSQISVTCTLLPPHLHGSRCPWCVVGDSPLVHLLEMLQTLLLSWFVLVSSRTQVGKSSWPVPGSSLSLLFNIGSTFWLGWKCIQIMRLEIRGSLKGLMLRFRLPNNSATSGRSLHLEVIQPTGELFVILSGLGSSTR